MIHRALFCLKFIPLEPTAIIIIIFYAILLVTSFPGKARSSQSMTSN